MDPDEDLREMAEAAQVLVRAAVEELRDHLLPTPTQWARAQALPQAREWVSQAVALTGDGYGAQIAELQLMIEGVTNRWAELILTGSTEEFTREELARRERGQD
jgi:hypothetical protein